MTTFENTAKKQSALIEVFDKVSMLVGERNGSVGLSMPAEAETCRYHANRLRTGIFKVLVMGAYSAGKSSFINALMCSQTLPEANTPCTSILTFIQYGDTSSCELFYRADGRKETMKLDDFFNTYRYTDDDEAEYRETGNVSRFAAISHAIVKTPLPLLRDGVQIIDSPGLNNNELDNALSLDTAEKANAILYLCSANEQYDMYDRAFFERKFRGCPNNVFYIINKSDLIPFDDQHTRTKVENDLKPYFSLPDGRCNTDLMQRRIFYVSALQAQYGLGIKTNDVFLGTAISDDAAKKYWEASGFERLRNELQIFLGTDEKMEAEYAGCFKRLAASYVSINDKIQRDAELYNMDSNNFAALKQQIETAIGTTNDKIKLHENQFALQTAELNNYFRGVYTQAADDLENSWELGKQEISKNINFTMASYAKLVGNQLNFFQSKQDRGNKLNEILEPFGNAVAQYFVRKMQDKINERSNASEKKVEEVLGELLASRQEVDSALIRLMRKLDLTNTVQTPEQLVVGHENVNPQVGRTIVSIMFSDFSQIADNTTMQRPMIDFVKRTVVNSIWQWTLVSVVGGPVGILAAMSIEAAQFANNKDKFVSSQLDKCKTSIIEALKKSVDSICQQNELRLANFMEETLTEYCAPVRTKLNDLETQLDDVQKAIHQHDFNREEELARCNQIKKDALAAIQVAYNVVYDRPIDENTVINMAQ